MLVGEKINPYLNFSHWPFFDDRDSARYISLSLERINIPEPDLLWTNATHPSEGLLVQTLVTHLPNLAVVSLGNVAHEKLVSLGISHRRVTHPQHARRFGQPESYDIALERAIRGPC